MRVMRTVNTPAVGYVSFGIVTVESVAVVAVRIVVRMPVGLDLAPVVMA